MERWIGRVALVTGASTGIGEAISRDLVKHGLKVIGCARSFDKLQKIGESLKDESGQFHPVKCDLRNEDEILAMFDQINAEHGGVDICINNAGVSINAPITTGNTADWRTMLDINVIALTICSREAIKSMKSRNIDDGHIIHINSLSGHRITTSSATHFYAATKFAVTAIAQELRNELRQMKSHIRISSISPGLVATDFWHTMHADKPSVADNIVNSIKCLEAKDISDAVIYVLDAPGHVQVQDILLRPTEQAR